MKHLVVLSFCIFALNIQACRGPSLDNETMCNKHRACKWTPNGCRNNFRYATTNITDFRDDAPLGADQLF